MTMDELKQIQLYRQHLTVPADKIPVVRDICGVQCQFLSNAYHSLRIRCRDALDTERWGNGLVKNWSVRGTVHVFAAEDLSVFRYDDGDYRSNARTGATDHGRLWISAQRERFLQNISFHV